MKMNSVEDMLISSARDMWAFVPRTFSTLCNGETPVNGQAPFTADHTLFTLQGHTDPWVLFQLLQQQRVHWCSHVGGSLSDLKSSMGGGAGMGRAQRMGVRWYVDTLLANFKNVIHIYKNTSQPASSRGETDLSCLPCCIFAHWTLFGVLLLSVITCSVF